MMNRLHRGAFGAMTGELHIGFFKGTAEAADSVSMLTDIASLGFVEDVASVFALVSEGLKQREKFLDGALEVDVVFPQCVIGINQDCFTWHVSGPLAPPTRVFRTRFRPAFPGFQAQLSACRRSEPDSSEIRGSFPARRLRSAECAGSCRASAPDAAAPRPLSIHQEPIWRRRLPLFLPDCIVINDSTAKAGTNGKNPIQ